MKDIDGLLRSVKKSVPRRNLSVAFTNNILNRISINEEKSNMFMKLFKKPLGVVLSIAIVVVSGTAAVAAVANWPSIVASITGVHALENGGRIVKIETEGCKPYDSEDWTSKRISYYEIKKDSSLTDERAVDMMRGVCEEERAQNRVG